MLTTFKKNPEEKSSSNYLYMVTWIHANWIFFWETIQQSYHLWINYGISNNERVKKNNKLVVRILSCWHFIFGWYLYFHVFVWPVDCFPRERESELGINWIVKQNKTGSKKCSHLHFTFIRPSRDHTKTQQSTNSCTAQHSVLSCTENEASWLVV